MTSVDILSNNMVENGVSDVGYIIIRRSRVAPGGGRQSQFWLEGLRDFILVKDLTRNATPRHITRDHTVMMTIQVLEKTKKQKTESIYISVVVVILS